MNKSATFDNKGEIIENTELNIKSVNVDCSEFIQKKLSDDTFGERLRKSRLELGLSISDVANLCGVTKSIISGYELGRYYPSKEILILISSKFNIEYLCMEGYTKLIYKFDDFLDKVNIWIKYNNYTRAEAANKLGVSKSLFRFWFNGGIISISTYEKIKDNLKNYNLFV